LGTTSFSSSSSLAIYFLLDGINSIFDVELSFIDGGTSYCVSFFDG
jgi:hypothetical protein